MKKFLPIERLSMHLVLTYLSLYASFLILYRDAFSTITVVLPFIFLSAMLFISISYALVLQRGMAFSPEALIVRGESLPWEKVEQLSMVARPWWGTHLIVRTPALQYALSYRQIRLWGDAFLAVLPEHLRGEVLPFLEKRTLFSCLTEKVIGTAEGLIAPTAILSLIVGSLVWQMPLVWCFVFTALVVVIPVLWALSVLAIALLFPRLLHQNFSGVLLFVAYFYSCLYLGYGTYFRLFIYQ